MAANRPTRFCRVCNAPFEASQQDYTVNCPGHRGRRPAAPAVPFTYPAAAPHPTELPEANAAECRRKAFAWSKFAMAYPGRTAEADAERARLRALAATLPDPD
jgi:hypothetical protein